MDKHKGLPRELQISLGRMLRDYYNTFLQSMPLDLVLLARKIRGGQSARDNPPSVSELLRNHTNSFDPETVAILTEAFDRAWNDLNHLSANPATPRTLATRLLALLNEGERDASRMATKAVLELVAPRAAYNATAVTE